MLFEIKRSESDIINNILSETKEGIKKTQLMYNAKMSNTQLTRYLDKLIEYEFIKEHNNSNDNTTYHLTKKGEQLDTALQQVFKILEEEK